MAHPSPSASIQTLGQLKAAGYTPRSIKDELRENLIAQLETGAQVFSGIQGYEHTVIPQVETALLAGHNMLFLGLRGQAKTRMARLMTGLLDEWIPVVAGGELNDDPFAPLSHAARTLIEDKGDDTPIEWMHRDARYAEKLATPDVSVADLIGDVDPIKAAAQKLSYADERVIHFGMIPRANRSIFVINELPDLQARIQVALFNILQEGDVQIRGFNLRLPLDIQFVFTANPEDYTNRGAIVTPLKDRIESQILTHYPQSLDIARSITAQEARLKADEKIKIYTPDLLKDLIEEIAFQARESEYVDQKSGVSARLTISAYETLHSHAERRLRLNKEKETTLRIADLFAVLPAITGKIELVYEGELEGPASVGYFLIGKAIRKHFEELLPSPEKSRKSKETPDFYAPVIDHFNQGHALDLLQSFSNKDYEKALKEIPGLEKLVKKQLSGLDPKDLLLYMEFVLHGLAECSQLSRQKIQQGNRFSDLMASMIGGMNLDDLEEDDDEQY